MHRRHRNAVSYMIERLKVKFGDTFRALSRVRSAAQKKEEKKKKGIRDGEKASVDGRELHGLTALGNVGNCWVRCHDATAPRRHKINTSGINATEQ